MSLRLQNTSIYCVSNTCTRSRSRRINIPQCKHVNIDSCIRTCMNLHMHTFIRTCINTYRQTYVHTYISTYMHTYMRTYAQTYKHTYMHPYPQTCIHTYILPYIHSYIRTKIHTNIRTAIHNWLDCFFIPGRLRAGERQTDGQFIGSQCQQHIRSSQKFLQGLNLLDS